MLVNALSYLVPIWTLAAMRVPDGAQDTQRPALGVALTEGLTTLWKQPTILGTIGLMAVVGGLAAPVYGMMPAFATDVLHAGSTGLGVLLACGALGSVIGTVVVAKLGAARRGRTLSAASLLLPPLAVGFALSRQMPLACLFLVALGLVLLVLQSLTITLVQIHVPGRVRGRVISLYSQLHAGSETAGNMLIGAVAVPLGLPLALSLGGLAAALYALGAWLAMPSVRRLD